MSTQTFSYDPFSPEVMSNPLPFYEVLRAEHPIHYLAEYDTYAFSRFADIWEGLNNPDLVGTEGTSPPATVLREHNTGPVPQPPTNPMGSFLRYESPVYDDVRRPQMGPMKARRAMSLEPLIQDLVRRQLEVLLPQGSFDLVQDFGGYVAAAVVCHLVGLPEEEAPMVLETVNRLTLPNPELGGFDREAVQKASVDFLAKAVTRYRNDEAAPEILNGMFDLEIDGRKLTDEEIAVNLVGIFVGGTETVPKVTAHGLWLLQEDRAQWEAVAADLEQNVRPAVAEMLRYCAPAQWFLRTAKIDTTVAGQPIRAGQRVIFLVASGSRDEAEFPNAHEFRWDRKISRTLALGRGQRFCMGAHIAQVEMNIMVTEFMRAVDRFVVHEEQAQRPPSNFQWGWTHVPITVTQRADQGV